MTARLGEDSREPDRALCMKELIRLRIKEGREGGSDVTHVLSAAPVPKVPMARAQNAGACPLDLPRPQPAAALACMVSH